MRRKRSGSARFLVLALLTLSFTLGAAAGMVAAVRLVEAGELSFQWLLPGYVQILDMGEGTAGFLSLFWDTLRWPLLVWLLGFTSLGRWAVPFLFALRGFFLAFCTAGLAGALGNGGLVLGLILFGLSGLATVPVFFSLGLGSWFAARRLEGRILPGSQDRIVYPAAFWARSLIAFLSLVLLTLVEYFLFPPLLRGTIPFLT